MAFQDDRIHFAGKGYNIPSNVISEYDDFDMQELVDIIYENEGAKEYSRKRMKRVRANKKRKVKW